MNRPADGHAQAAMGPQRDTACLTAIHLPALLRLLPLRRLTVAVDVQARIHGDLDLLSRLLSPLFDDARRHGATRVEMRLSCRNGCGFVTMADNRGPRIGSSMGLLQLHSGSLWPDSEPAHAALRMRHGAQGRRVEFMVGPGEPALQAHLLIVDA